MGVPRLDFETGGLLQNSPIEKPPFWEPHFRVQFFWDFWGPRLGFRNIGKSVALELNFNLISNVATILGHF